MSYTPKRPYIVRAFHEWLEENNLTAYIMIDATHQELIAPIEYAQDGKLVLAISYQATHDLFIDNEAISFKGRFGGVSQDVWIPMPALIGIYAKEDPSQGAFFDTSEYDNVPASTQADKVSPKSADTPKATKPNTSHLKIIK
ncbi:MAG: ClpXP protease specificity-enhancing factor SspB [Moraxella sp.]|nr:ClpXP protease specificity-enhancing factor SspB [Moraxella sp.]